MSVLAAERGKAALAAWRRIEAEAHAELSSGHQAALAVERESKPWERARFLAILEAFVDEWQPRGGIELALIDQMAQAHASYLVWMERLRMQSASEGRAEAYNLKRDGCWQPSRVDKARGLDQAAPMADRFHPLFLRALRGLRDLRRYAPSVVVQNAGQVNVGARQVNVSGG